MSTMCITLQPAVKFNWADDDEDDDFDLEVWKASADISAPSAESLPPLQLEDAASSPSSCYYTTSIASSPPYKAASFEADYTQPPTPSPAVAIPVAQVAQDDVYEDTAAVAWRVMREVSDSPAYPEMSMWGDYRQYYAREWGFMKERSGFDCRRTVLYRFSRLREVWNTEDDEEVVCEEQAVELASAEEGAVCEEAVQVEVEEKDFDVEIEVEDLEPFPDFHQVDLVTRFDLVQDEDLEPLHDIKDAGMDMLVDATPATDTTDIQNPTIEDGEMPASIHFPTKTKEMNSLPPIIISPPIPPHNAEDLFEDDDLIFPIEDLDLPDCKDAFLPDPDSDSDSESSSIPSSPLSFPTIIIPLNTSKNSTLTAPLSPIYHTTHIGLSPASAFIKMTRQMHKRRDSQEALEHGDRHIGDVDDGVGDIDVDSRDAPRHCDVEQAVDDVKTHETAHEKVSATIYIRGKAVAGWEFLSKVSWTATAAVVGVGGVLGGVLRVARRWRAIL